MKTKNVKDVLSEMKKNVSVEKGVITLEYVKKITKGLPSKDFIILLEEIKSLKEEYKEEAKLERESFSYLARISNGDNFGDYCDEQCGIILGHIAEKIANLDKIIKFLSQI